VVSSNSSFLIPPEVLQTGAAVAAASFLPTGTSSVAGADKKAGGARLAILLSRRLNRRGEKVGRLIGPAEWDSPEMTESIRSTISANRKEER
jgi:hypothetical protein